MDAQDCSAWIVEEILKELDRIAGLLGDDWPKFRAQALEILHGLIEAEERLQPLWVNKLIHLGRHSPAAGVFEEILHCSQAMVPRDRDRLESKELTTEYYVSPGPPKDEAQDQAVSRILLQTVARDVTKGLQLCHAAIELADALAPDVVAKGLPSPRYLNAGFFAADALLPTDQPLALQSSPYRLGVNVGDFWGPGYPGKPVPQHLLEPYFEQESRLTLDVAVRSLDVEAIPEHALLDLPREGDSPIVFFDLHFTRTGRQAINVDLLFHGHLLQSRRIEVEVVTHAGIELPASAWPVQDGYVTFTRTAMLEPPTLEVLCENPRGLTIVAERDLDLNRIGLRFYDNTGTDLGFQQSTLTDANLTQVLAAVRGQLAGTMDAYTGTVGSTEAVLARHLGQLAAVGRKFYLALLPGLANQDNVVDEGQRLDVNLQPGMAIQVAPLSSQLGVPWELLYERKIEAYREDRITLCSTFLEHGPAFEDCPSCGDPTVVCPLGFWGYRYIIEQLPCRVDPHEPLRGTTLPLQIGNVIPLRLNANVSLCLNQVDAHLESLRALAPEAQLELVRADSLDGVKAALVDTNHPADIVYFYAHGGRDRWGSPYLEVGTGDQIQLIDLDAWEVDLYRRRPLVVLNACESADYAPDSFENMVRFFCNAGAAGVIGTQCGVKEKLADAFVIAFFRSFFGQVSAGQALFEARQMLLRKHLDPRGLTYSLFASADVKLAQPIIAQNRR